MAGKNVLILFDLVSTVTDAGARYAQAFQDVCRSRGVNVPEQEEILEMLGNKNLSEIIDYFLGPMPQDEKKALMFSCNNACDALLYRPDWHEALYPGVREVAEALTQDGATLGIFTGTREDAMQAQLSYHGLTFLFDAAYTRGKDNTRDAGKDSDTLKAEQINSLVAQFRKETGGKDGVVIIVGDSESDATAAAQAGHAFIGFAPDETKKNRLEKAGVFVIISDFGDLAPEIERLKAAPPGDKKGPKL